MNKILSIMHNELDNTLYRLQIVHLFVMRRREQLPLALRNLTAKS